MSWHDEMQSGSFRGVPFLTAAIDTSIGRRVATHEYPDKNAPYQEDMGRQARGFVVQCYVVGADYMQARNALIKAIEKKGAGKLIHPFMGEINVQALTARVREGSGQEGMARISVTFAEAGNNAFPAINANTVAQLDGAADAALQASQDDFNAVFSVDDLPQFVADSAQEIAQSAVDLINKLPSFDGDLTRLDLTSLTRQAGRLSTALTDAIKRVDDAADLRQVVAFGGDMPAVAVVTATRAQQAGNQAALLALVNTAGAVEMARRLVAI